MKVLVTGGAGFVGANLVRLLVAEHHSLRILDDFSTGIRDHLAVPNIEIVEGDVRDAQAALSTCKGVDAVVHLAAQTGVPASLQAPREDFEINVLGTLNLLEACRKEKVDRLILASSNASIGRQDPPAREDKAPLPVSPYGAGKLAAEAYCLAYQGSWGVNTIALRFSNVYGPFSKHKSSVVAQFLKDASKGELVINGDGGHSRDFIYVSDLCRAIVRSLQCPLGGEVFQIATGVKTSIKQLAETVLEVTGCPAQLVFKPARRGDVRTNYSEIRKAKDMLDWEPRVDLRTGLQHTWDWFQGKGISPESADRRL